MKYIYLKNKISRRVVIFCIFAVCFNVDFYSARKDKK